MKKFIIPEKGNFYKACLHTHSVFSDGYYTPEKVKEIYKSAGFSVVAFTDHEYLFDHSYLNDDNFITITSYELDTCDEMPGPYDWHKSVHLNFYSKDPHNIKQVCYEPEFVYANLGRMNDMEYHGKTHWRLHTVDDINYTIREANEHGFFVCYNHPIWSLHNTEDYLKLEGLWGYEVHNTGSFSKNLPENENIYDDLLRKGNRIAIVASDDMHTTNHFNDGWVVIRAEKLEYKTIIDALLNKEFYASQGPEIYECYEEDGYVHVKTSPVKRIVLKTEGRATAVASSETAEGITEAVLKIPENAGAYYRLTVYGFDRRNAWTNAVFFEEE